MVRFGILSFAHMHAASYAQAITELPNAELVGVADKDRERGERTAAAFDTRFFSREGLLAQRIDAVIVGSENAEHAEWTLAAVAAGKHVLCEKPISTSLEDARRMIEACQARKVKLATAFPCRYLPSVQSLKQACDAGQFGRILAVRGTNHGSMPGGWFTSQLLAGGGAVMDHTVHLVDLARWLLGAEVVNVYAEVDRRFYPDLEVDDCGMLSLELDNGAFMTIDPSWSRPKCYPFWGDVTLEVVGSEGVAFLDGFAQKLDLYSDEQGKGSWLYCGSDIDLELIKAFVASIENNTDPPTTGLDGLRALEVALAAYESAKRKEPVTIASLRGG